MIKEKGGFKNGKEPGVRKRKNVVKRVEKRGEKGKKRERKEPFKNGNAFLSFPVQAFFDPGTCLVASLSSRPMEVVAVAASGNTQSEYWWKGTEPEIDAQRGGCSQPPAGRMARGIVLQVHSGVTKIRRL